LGYSLYDTIVVFDRIRENIVSVVHVGRRTYSDAVNDSMNQVLARSINTSLVAIIPILSVLVVGAYIMGATTLKNFGLALFVGLTTGAYSSIFIASPILAWFKEKEPRYKTLRQTIGSGKRASKAQRGKIGAAEGNRDNPKIDSRPKAEVAAGSGSGSGTGSRLVSVESLHGSTRPSSKKKSKNKRR
jgi:preprotein translocase subunit SecF